MGDTNNKKVNNEFRESWKESFTKGLEAYVNNFENNVLDNIDKADFGNPDIGGRIKLDIEHSLRKNMDSLGRDVEKDFQKGGK